MDIKVAGTREGATALQMDIKIPSVDFSIIATALEKAKMARLSILDKMAQAISQPRSSTSIHAPKMISVTIPVEKIGALIGPGGKNIRRISEEYSVEVEVQDDGRVFIHAKDMDSVTRAKAMVEGLTKDPEIGQVYKGRITSITDFGAFVEILPGREGLLHVSQIDHRPVRHASDFFKEDDEVEVKVLDVDDQGKVRLSRKALIEPGPGQEAGPSDGPPPSGGSHGEPSRGFGLRMRGPGGRPGGRPGGGMRGPGGPRHDRGPRRHH